MEIHREYRAHDGRYNPGANNPRYIVIHYACSGTDSARTLALSLHNNSGNSSWHYSVGNDGIWQSLWHADKSWSVGAWSGATQYIGNGEVISIEVCNDGGEFSQRQKNYLRDLVLYIMDDEGIDADHVVRHYDCHSGHKLCPEGYCGSTYKDNLWKELHKYITSEPQPESYETCVWNSHGGNNQKWLLNKKDGGLYEIESFAHRGFVLDVRGAHTDNGTPVILWQRNNGDNQRWYIVEDKGVVSHIEPYNAAGMRLDVKGAVCKPGTRLELWEANDTVAQDFVILPCGDGTIQILNNHPDTKLVVDVVGG